MAKPNVRAAIAYINKNNLALAFPVKNEKIKTPSLWHLFHPRTPMRWEWDDSGSTKVFDLWHFRAQLSLSGRVCYSKWYRGRGTFLSHNFFKKILAVMWDFNLPVERQLPLDSRNILETLMDNSPQSPKIIKKVCDLRGKFNQAAWNKAIAELWTKGLIIAWGEVDDGAFPSLALASTQRIQEKLWHKAATLEPRKAWNEFPSPWRFYVEKMFRKNPELNIHGLRF